MVTLRPGIINTAIVPDGIMRGHQGVDHDKIAAFYDKHGAPPGTFAAAVLDALARPCLVVVSPRSQVLAPYLSQRLSPWLTQSLARVITKEGQPLWATRV